MASISPSDAWHRVAARIAASGTQAAPSLLRSGEPRYVVISRRAGESESETARHKSAKLWWLPFGALHQGSWNHDLATQYPHIAHHQPPLEPRRKQNCTRTSYGVTIFAQVFRSVWRFVNAAWLPQATVAGLRVRHGFEWASLAG